MRTLGLSPSTWLVLVFVATVSWTVREVDHQRIPVPERNTWVTSDPDTQYQVRRVYRAFDEGLAGSDPYLSFPDGSPIPWPPYYTAIAWAWSAPGAPAAGSPANAEARRDWIERRVASLPRTFGVATSVLAAIAGVALAGPVAGLVAGTSHALSAASVVTSRVGNGDHHALIALLALAMLVLCSRAFREEALADVRGSVRRGVVVGAVAGLALGSWVASLVYIVHLQLMLGWMIARHTRRPLPGLPGLGIALHLAALAVALPAIAVSPWNGAQPFAVVNLTWFHALWLAAGAMLFAPLLRLRSGALFRFYAPIVAIALVGVVLLLANSSWAPAAGVREGFAWLGRDDEFMSIVGESRGMGSGAFSPYAILGYGVLLVPVAWLAAARAAFVRGRGEMLPWAVAFPLLFAQAFRQARFADVVAAPLALLVGWAIVAAWRSPALERARAEAARLGRSGPIAAALLLVGATFLAHAPLVRVTLERLGADPNEAGIPQPPADRVAMELAEWIRRHTPAPADYAVLAPWTWGHTIEWVADRPSVATNFGLYVGADAFRAPARFFLEEDPARAEARLVRRRVRYVLVTTWLANQLPPMIRAVDPTMALEERYLVPDAERVTFQPEWYRTIGARLLFDGSLIREDGSTGESLDFVRLVAPSRDRDPRFKSTRPAAPPIGTVWERVPGAIVEARGAVGDRLQIGLLVHYPSVDYRLVWSNEAVAGADGVARVRVPYATDAANGEGVAAGPAIWRFGGREGEVAIPENVVQERGVVRIEGGAGE